MNMNKIVVINGKSVVRGQIDRVRRITGYLTGTLSRWNDAKKEEEKDRVKHNIRG